MDWAGIAPAIAAAVQSAAVVVQLCWERRQRRALAPQHPVFGELVPTPAGGAVHSSCFFDIRIGLHQIPHGPVSVTVRVETPEGTAGHGPAPAKEHGPW
ncbi:hypothetical protein [Streptomyces hydrogenans]|uniref:hypothetical protein n=1 Tax=Streptomyces hydrogenans TaxID=1873719 RepID=UPI00345D0E70